MIIPLVKKHSLSLNGGCRRYHLDLTEGGHPYWVALTGFGYNLSGTLATTVLYEYSNQNRGTEVALGEWVMPIPRKHYLSLFVTYYPPKPLDGMSVALSVGSQRGGHKCAGGVCREFPDSVGAKIEASYRF